MDTPTQDDFWDHLDDVQAGMLAVGRSRAVPMSHYVDREANALWFITAQGTDIATSLEAQAADAVYIIASGNGQLYARIHGQASLSNDREKLDELWNAIADAWFDGERDPDIRLVKIALSEAEVWTTPGGLGFLYQIAKANVTGEEPDMGAHGTLRFAA